MRLRALLLGAACFLPLIAGCSKSGARPGSKVTGKVTWNGTPVAGAKIVFTDGKEGSGATPNGPSAITDDGGEYALIGVPPGAYKVCVYKLIPKPGAVLPPEGEGMDLEQIEASGMGSHGLPRKYASPASTTLVAQIGDSKQKEDFELKGEANK